MVYHPSDSFFSESVMHFTHLINGCFYYMSQGLIFIKTIENFTHVIIIYFCYFSNAIYGFILLFYPFPRFSILEYQSPSKKYILHLKKL